jgi:hypothetical protein
MIRPTRGGVDRPRRHERGATRAQYLVFLVLVTAAFAVAAVLLWMRLYDDSGIAVNFYS